MFPGVNINVADESNKTIIDHVKKLNTAGHKHLVMVVGSDRVPEVKKLLDKYNGSEFNFKKIDVVSAGNRDPDAEGPTGMSATKMRAHAIGGKWGEFQKGIPSHVAPEHAKEMYNELRKAMDIKIDANTSNISLVRYAKRKDVIGTRARNEIKRRQAMVKHDPVKKKKTTGRITGSKR